MKNTSIKIKSYLKGNVLKFDVSIFLSIVLQYDIGIYLSVPVLELLYERESGRTYIKF